MDWYLTLRLPLSPGTQGMAQKGDKLEHNLRHYDIGKASSLQDKVPLASGLKSYAGHIVEWTMS